MRKKRKNKAKITDIGSIIINFLRPETTISCIESLRGEIPNLKIYIGDQDDDNSLLKNYCEARNINYIKLPFDCGIGVSRNTLVEKAKLDGCKYIMWGDNDFVYDSRFRLQNMLKVLNKDKKVGIVGGTVLKNNIVQHYERIIYYNEDYQTACFIPLEYTYPEVYYAGEVDYYYCDMTFNFCLARMEIFDENVRWDDEIKVKFEHSFFFCKYLKYSKFKVAYCPSVMVKHEHGKNDIYSGYRNRVSDGEAYARKLHLKTGFAINGQSWNHLTQDFFNFKKVASLNPIIISALKYNYLEKPPTKQKITEVSNKNIKFYSLLDIIQYLKEKKINFVLIDKSCLQVVRERRFKDDDKILYIGIEGIDVHSILINDGFKQEAENEYSYEDYKIILSSYTNTTKKFMVEYEEVNVPYPVISYLVKKYGRKWETLNE